MKIPENPVNFLIYTFGCKVNSYDSAAMSQVLIRHGYQPAGSEQDADILIVNSCTVTANSDRKVRQLLRRLRRSWPDKTLVLCGCLPQANPGILDLVPDVDVVMGTGNRGDIASVLAQYHEKQTTVSAIRALGGRGFEPLEADDIEGHTRAFLKIEEGCDRFCAYCVIPYARGGITSMALPDIDTAVRRFAVGGYTEIVLTGINLSFYGRGAADTLADAVRTAAAVDGIVRIRLGSLEPDLLSDDLIAQLAAVDKLCPQFHLSLQSGCDRTLGRMKRHYTAAQYRETVARLGAAFDRPTFTTDVIVGFPGETDADFRESLDFVRSVGFLKVHVFPYSERPGTVAAALPDAVPRAARTARAAAMTAACDAVRAGILASAAGSAVRVIAEQPAGDGFRGYTDRYLPALLRGEGIHTGDVVRGIITRIMEDCCVVDADSSKK